MVLLAIYQQLTISKDFLKNDKKQWTGQTTIDHIQAYYVSRARDG